LEQAEKLFIVGNRARQKTEIIYAKKKKSHPSLIIQNIKVQAILQQVGSAKSNLIITSDHLWYFWFQIPHASNVKIECIRVAAETTWITRLMIKKMHTRIQKWCYANYVPRLLGGL
jgi:hypothetical protein